MFYLFLYTLFLFLFLPLFFPFWHVPIFAPFIVLCFYRHSMTSCLCWSFCCGFIIDLFSAETQLGNYALNYCLTTLCLYRYQFHFFEDRLSTLPTMTFFFTSLSTMIQIVIFQIISRPFALSWHWLFSDLLFIPFQAAICAGVAFVIPSLLLVYLKREYLLFRLSRRRP